MAPEVFKGENYNYKVGWDLSIVAHISAMPSHVQASTQVLCARTVRCLMFINTTCWYTTHLKDVHFPIFLSSMHVP